jgi:acylaminoacyl-peptidase
LIDEDYDQMLKVSPIYFIKEKVSPALLMLGEKDRRVPPSQGFRWAEYLASKNHTVQVMTFPKDGHALDSFDAERVGFKASVNFMISHLKQ